MLEDDAYGRRGITLERREYDTIALKVGFMNRFERAEKA